MRQLDGNFQCIHCGARLDISIAEHPQVTIHAAAGRPNVRVLIRNGTEIHRCELGSPVCPPIETTPAAPTASDDGYHPVVVHQASGAIAAQLNISPAEGLQIIRIRARASDTSTIYIAGAIMRGEIRFD